MIRRILGSACCGAMLWAWPASSASAQVRGAAEQAGQVDIVISTPLGDILATLDSARAPVTVANFLRYVDAGRYANGRFHRTVTPANQPNDSVRIEVIQGGVTRSEGAPSFGPIMLEPTGQTGLRHVNGALSMARAGPHTATSDFFIVLGDHPSLDEGGTRNLDLQGFAAFGRVTSGLDVVRAIQREPHDGQTLTPVVPILNIRRAIRPPADAAGDANP